MSEPPESLRAALSGRYELERELGRGGMATVYLARDIRHDRAIALKTLLPELGAVLGPERFLAEIRVMAHLQHPHLLPLFDSGEAGGLLYYTMPYVEGESLRDRFERERQLPVDEAVRIGVAVASALDYAHRHGVIHRDLKPENILLADGHPVVADFGIALAVSKAGGARVTQTGISLGTPQYMSPEQATGDRALDGRTDVYSLGAVLYEALTGDPPHTGSTVQAVIAKVLTEKPRSIRALRPTVPEHVERVIDRALAKLPADRWVTATQLAEALQGRLPPGATVETGGDATIVTATARPRAVGRRLSLRRLLPWVVVPLALLLGFMLGTWRPERPGPESTGPVRFVLPMPESERLVTQGGAVALAISPDGRTLAYIGRSGGGSRLYIRPLGELQARPLAGTDNAQSPFFSPDGHWIAFVAPGQQERVVVKKVPVRGTGTVTISEFPGLPGASRLGPGIVGGGGAWSSSGVIVLGSERGLFQVSASGGTARRLTVVDTAGGEIFHGVPRFLPDGHGLLFGIDVAGSEARDRIAMLSPGDSSYTTLVEGVFNPLGVVSRELFFARGDGTLATVPLDLRQRRITDEPLTILDSLQLSGFGSMNAALSDNGTLAYIQGSPLSQLTLVNTQGSRVGGSDDWRAYDSPRISPDGRRIAVGVFPSGSFAPDVWIYEISSNVLSRLTTDASGTRPEWTPDGRWIAYLNARGLNWDAWWAPADGSRPGERLFGVPNARISEITFAPTIGAVLRMDRPGTGRDIELLRLRGHSAARTSIALVASPANEIHPDVSPDGRLLAYVSDETGALEVYVRPFPGPGGRLQVSSGGGSEPRWSADGKRLFYRSAGHFVAASLAGSPSLAVVAREELFEDRYKTSPYRSRFDVHPDGERFVVLRPPAESQELVVVVNWLTELKTRLARDDQGR